MAVYILLGLGCVLLSLFGVLNIMTLINIVKMKEQVQVIYSSQSEFDKKLTNIDEIVSGLISGPDFMSNDEMMDGIGTGDQKLVYRSLDGKYVADSLPELMEKMIEGGDLIINPADIEIIKNFFFNARMALEQKLGQDYGWLEIDEDDEGGETYGNH